MSLPRGIDGGLIVDVVADSPAGEAELDIGDIIRAIDGCPVHRAADAARELRRIAADEPLFLLVWRDGTELFLQMERS